MHRIVLLSSALLTAPAFAQECEQASTVDQLGQALIDVQEPMRQPEFDPQAFGPAMGPVNKHLKCVDAIVPASAAARVHLVKMFAKDPLGTNPGQPEVKAHALGLLSLNDDGSLAKENLPAEPGHLKLLSELVPSEVTERAPKPQVGELVFDGARTLERPTEAATIFQHVDESGAVLQTAIVLPGNPLPTYEAAGGTTGNPLLFVSAGAGVAAGGLWAGSFVSNGALKNSYATGKPNSEAPTYALAGSAFALGGVALGTGIAALLGKKQ